METCGGLCRTGLTEAALDVPLEVQASPVKACSDGIDHGGLLPGREKVLGLDLGEVCAQNLYESVVGQARIIPQAAPEHPVVPVLGHLELMRDRRFCTQELTAPDIPVRAVVVARRNIVGDILDKFPHEVRCTPVEVVVAVVPQGPDRFEAADVLDEIVAVWLLGGAEYMSFSVFETEDKVDGRVIDQGLEGLGDVLGPGLVLAVDQPDLAPGLGRGCVQDALAVCIKGPCLLLGGAHIGHALACGQADAGQVWVGQEHLLDTLTEEVRGGRIVVLVRQSVLAVSAVYEDVPGDHVEIHVAVLAIAHTPRGRGFS